MSLLSRRRDPLHDPRSFRDASTGQLPFGDERGVPETETETETISFSEVGNGDCCPWPQVGQAPTTTELLDAKAERPTRLRASDWNPQDIVDEWGVQSFPASDPPANW
jgi:hypothetical protein